MALNSLEHNLFSHCALLCIILLHSASFCFLPHLFVPPGQSHTFPPHAFYLLPPSSLYSCVSQLSCHKNEFNLSPSVQTTIDRVGTFRKTNCHLPSLLGIGCMCVCACVLLMRLRGQMKNRPMPKSYPGSFINMSSSQCLLNQQKIQTNDVNNNK